MDGMISASIPAATRPGPHDRLLVVDPAGHWTHDRLSALPTLLGPDDVLVLNDAATLPASLRSDDGAHELRLAAHLGDGRWEVGVLGAGDWRTPTEHRPAPAPLPDVVRLGGGLVAHVEARAGRFAIVRLGAPGGWLRAVYRAGAPVRYAYLDPRVGLADVQTAWAGPPVASEAPSAGLPLRWGLLLALRRAGVTIATLTHAAGLSSIDGGVADRALPRPEQSTIPPETVAAITRAHDRGGRVIAVGTTVVRALEGRVADAGRLVAGTAVTDLRIGPTTALAVVDGLLTKPHEPGESHFELLAAFAPRRVLVDALNDAAGRGYRQHEFGDSVWIAPR